jgi:ABC-2 type transport system permease protein
MRGLGQLVLTAFRLYLREPITLFFTLAFPPLLVLLFGAMYGNDPSPFFNGRGSMDVSMPAYTALIVGSVGMMTVPTATCALREQGALRRYRATPMSPLAYILADVVTNLGMTILGMGCLVLVGWLIYRVRFEGNVLSFGAALVLGSLAMFAVGYLIASLAKTARMAQVIAMAVFYPMMFLSGAGMPIELLPETLRKASLALPLTYTARLLRGMWFGEPWKDHLLEVGVLTGILILGAVLSARFFKWE